MGEIVYGNVKKPPVIMRLIPDVQTGAWDYLGPRKPIGIVSHTDVGTKESDDRWFRRGAQSTGLTDFVVGRDGTIFQWNDPWGKEHWVKLYVDKNGWTVYSDTGQTYRVSANRAGWANGGSDGLEGDGPIFVRTRGINAINRDLVSIEREDKGHPHTEPFDGPQFSQFCKLVAWIYDQIQVPWDRFPVNPNLAQAIVTYFFHMEFATKGCPWEQVMEKINETQNTIRGILKAGQVSEASTPIDPPNPPDPDHDWLPVGWTPELLDKQFGTLTRRKVDGTVIRSGFSMKGIISNAWIQRGIAEGREINELPPASYMAETHNSKLTIGTEPATEGIVLFDGRGADNWVLTRPDESIAWRWMI